MARFRLRRNADPQLREAERAYAAGDVDAGVAYLGHLLRIGRLNQAGLNQLSILGDRAARVVVPQPEVDGWLVPPVEDWFEFIGSTGRKRHEWLDNYLHPSGWRFAARMALAASRGACRRYWLKRYPEADSPEYVEAYGQVLMAYVKANIHAPLDPHADYVARVAAADAWTPWWAFAVSGQLISGQPYKPGTLHGLHLDSVLAAEAAESSVRLWADEPGPWEGRESNDPWDVAASQAAFSASSLASAVLDAPQVGEEDSAQSATWPLRAIDALDEALNATHEFHPVDVAWQIVTKDIQREVIPWLVS